MSVKALHWALTEAPVDDPTEALVLVALADNAHDDGRNAWPSQATLARKARVTDRTVRRILSKLESEQLISRGDQRLVEHLPADRRPVVWNLDVTRVRSDLDGRTPTSARTPVTERPDTDVRSRPDTDVRQTVPMNRPELLEPRKRGTRLPAADWLTTEMRGYAEERGYTDRQIRALAEDFADYWAAQPGQKGVKLDWPATWRRWVRNTREQPAGRTPAVNGTKLPAAWS